MTRISIIFFTFLFLNYNYAICNQLKLTIELEKEIFYEGEDIWVFVNLVNVSNSHERVYYYDTGTPYVFFSLLDGTENIVRPFVQDYENYWQAPYVDLNPNDTLQVVINILDFYCNNINRRGPLPTFCYLVDGKYSIKAKFRHFIKNQDNHHEQLYIHSNREYFEVRKPYEEELEVFWKIRNALGYRLENNTKEYVNALQDIIRFYPESVYITTVYELLAIEYSVIINEKQKAYDIRRNIIMNYPDSGASVNALRNFYLQRVDKAFINDIERKIIEEKGHTRVGTYIRKRMRTE